MNVRTRPTRVAIVLAAAAGLRMTDAVLDVKSGFRLGCAGLPSPAPPAFDVEYRITPR